MIQESRRGLENVHARFLWDFEVEGETGSKEGEEVGLAAAACLGGRWPDALGMESTIKSGLLDVRLRPDFIRRLILKDRERLSDLDDTSDGAFFLPPPAAMTSSSNTSMLSSMPVRIMELGRIEKARLIGGIAACF
jgi:hypothetical protein